LARYPEAEQLIIPTEQAFDGLDGFCQRFTQDLFLLLKKLHFLAFFVSEVSPGFQLRLKLFPFFRLRHAATVADLPRISQRHSPSE
jgi:hypothetical protein